MAGKNCWHHQAPSAGTGQSARIDVQIRRRASAVAQPGDPVRHLIESHPADFLGLVGIHTDAPIDVIDADLGPSIAAADKVLVTDMFLRGRWMEESVTYQAIIRKGMAKGRAEAKANGKAEGMVEEARRILLLLGTDAFGAPDAATNATIAGILDRDRLEALIDRVGEVKDWQALLAKPR